MSETAMTPGAPDWRLTERPARLERRFNFDSYAETRDFLDRLAELSKEEGFYPDLSFGRTHVHVSVNARDDAKVGETDVSFANRVSRLVTGTAN